MMLLQKNSFWCDTDCDGTLCWILLLQVRVLSLLLLYTDTLRISAELNAFHREV